MNLIVLIFYIFIKVHFLVQNDNKNKQLKQYNSHIIYKFLFILPINLLILQEGHHR